MRDEKNKKAQRRGLPDQKVKITTRINRSKGLYIVIILLSLLLMGATKAPPRTVRVCVYENAPKIFTAADGTVTGFWPELIHHIAAKEGWQIEWVHSTWDECLQKLSTGEIDILPDTGWTPERSRKYAFSNETVLLSWSRLYAAKGTHIESILDLAGKTIAGLANSVNMNGPGGIKDLTAQFGLHCKFVKMDTYDQVFQALEQGQVDAGITNKDFGNLNEGKYNVVRTSIVFQPARVLFAFPKNGALTPYLIERIDANMKALKADKDSLYYQALDKYLGAREASSERVILPNWAKFALLALVGIALFLLAVWSVAVVQVRRRTRALRESEEQYRTLFNSTNVGIGLSTFDGKFISINPTMREMMQYGNAEWKSLEVADIYYDREERARIIETIRREGSVKNHETRVRRKDRTIIWVNMNIVPIKIQGEKQLLVTMFDISDRKQAEEALRESEERYRSIVEHSQEGIFILDDAYRFTYVNDRVCRVLNCSRQEIVGHDFRGFLDEESREMVVDRYLQRQRGENVPSRYVFGIVRPDGEKRRVELSSNVIRDSTGKIKTIGQILDITERVRAEEALRTSEARLRAITESAQDAILMVDPADNISFWNQAAERIFGYTKEEALGQNMGKLIVPPRYYKAHKDAITIFQKSGQGNAVGKTMELAARRKDGQEFPVELSLSALELGNGWNGVGIIRDITKRKRAEEERTRLATQIHEQARQVEQVLATMPEGVLLLDADGRVLQANPTAEDDLAILASAKVGDRLTHLGDRPLAELLTPPPTKGLWHEVKVNSRTFEVIAQPMDYNAKTAYWVLVINDVTQEREIRAELRQQERLAAVGQLAAGIAHDFNNIMAIIVLYTYMGLQTPDIPSKLRERLHTISRQAHRATDLIQQILDFSRRSVLERRPMDLTPFLKEIIKMMERTIPEDIELKFSYGTDEYMVNADPTRIQQAIMNLVVNARDAMPKGGELRIALSKTTEADEIRCVTCSPDPIVGREWVRITVTDTGDGIPPDVLSHIFEPFFTTKAVGKGTGLGLAQVYGIVKQHEGHIGVTTKLGEGTTFTIYLPALRAHRRGTDVLKAETFIQGRGEIILVVEDDATLREALVDTLELLNYRVLEAANGREALDILTQRAEEVALVLSDLVMPEMGGQALFHAMRQRGLTLPVVMLSGHAMENELKSLQAQGLAGWLLKPSSPEKLAQLLTQVLNE